MTSRDRHSVALRMEDVQRRMRMVSMLVKARRAVEPGSDLRLQIGDEARRQIRRLRLESGR